jgi:ectoine hydroxylase-related dioxygenase (phytanoyl-CoA dioxygenase family)
MRALFKHKPGSLRGSIDTVHNGCCQGWAIDTRSASPVAVELFIDGQRAGRALADLHRGDLEREGMGDGRRGFSIEIPAALRDGRHHRVEARSRDGRLIAARDAMQIVPKLTPAEFDRRAPWIDRDDAEFERELARLRQTGAADAEIESRLRFFREHGWLKLEQAVSHALIEKVLVDVEQAWCDLPPQLVLSNALKAPTPMGEVTRVAGFRDTSMRYLDFHNASEAAAEIMMLPAVLRFAEACFGEKIAAMQTLLFENGTQQASHQDFAFVHSLRPACLMGAWVALEDARADAGPLFYWDRSHRVVPKYAFDDESVLAEGDGPHVRAFENYLENACRERGLERLVFTPRKGDLLIWHSALVHGGMPRNDPALTRRSMVSHYTTQEAYPYDRREPNADPLTLSRNGGIYYGWQRQGHVERRYPMTGAARPVA